MTQDRNIETLKRCYAAWHDTRGGSVDAWLEIVSDDFSLRSMAGGRAGAEFTAARNSRDELAGYLSSLTEAWEMEYYHVDRYIADDEIIVVLGSTSWINKSTGKRAESQKADFWTFRDGKAVSFIEFYDSCALVEAGT